MADPVTMAVVMMGTKLAGSFISANAEASSAKASAAAAEQNAEISRRNARLTSQQTASDVADAERLNRLRIGANIAAMGASGVSGGSGVDILLDNATRQKMDIMNIQREGLLKQQNYLIQGGMYSAEAKNTKAQIGPSKAASILSGVSGAIGTGVDTGVF